MKKIIAICLTALLTACGGGGSSVVNTPVTRIVSAPIPFYDLSYRNFKESGHNQIQMAKVVENMHLSTAYSVSDFDRTGNRDLFVAELIYDHTSLDYRNSPRGKLKFFQLMSDGSYVEARGKIVNDDTGCIHPRKSVVADFNNDGRPDIFVACVGHDQPPFPGETNKVILSNGDGTYTARNASPDVGFWHGAATLDVDRDGDIDVIATDNFDSLKVVTFLNDGRGNFTRDSVNRFPQLTGDYYTIEAVDVNQDGSPDILLGGHEFYGTATLLFTNPTHNYVNEVPLVIPEVYGQGIVVDFAVTGTTTKVIWVLRTSGGGGNPVYEGTVLQRYDLDTNISTVVYSERLHRWVPWIIPIGNDLLGAINSYAMRVRIL